MKPRYRPIKSTVKTFITSKGTGLKTAAYVAKGMPGVRQIRREMPLQKGALTGILKRAVIQLNEIEIGRIGRAVKGSIVLVGDSLGRIISVSGNKANILVTHDRKAHPMSGLCRNPP
ncbi:MAG: hypothetical protein COT15_02085 [Candidatus Diapherotrites archaeon CG08_land_8_20_14_0_20_34_12]|nr:MAG: hypothetical protein COT15_02085 [Candidatus Diapherotrites archaeon CG08_land_8_20_14_0_20_34_12]